MISFAGMMMHEIIPHHHHEEYAGHNGSFHSHCQHDHLHVPLEGDCGKSIREKVDHSHDCPHHSHPCLEKVYERVQTKRLHSDNSKEIAKWVLPAGHNFSARINKKAFNTGDHTFLVLNSEGVKCLLLRGPPSKC